MRGGSTASRTALPTTTGVYQRAKRVMNCSDRAFRLPAFSTRSRIFATVESPNSLVVRTRSTPVRLTQPEITSSPGWMSRGRDSPVRAAVFRVETPSSTTPSRGTRSPGRMTMVSPTVTSSGSTRRVLPFSSKLA